MQEVSKFKSHNKQNKKATEHLSSSRTFKEKVTLDLLAKVMRTSVSISGEESMVYGVLQALTFYCLLMLPELNRPVRVDYSIISSSVPFYWQDDACYPPP